MKPFFLRLVVILGCLICTVPATGAGKNLTIAVIPKGTSHEFWKSIHAGAVKAKRELEDQGYKINLIWKGPIREDDRDQQIAVVENFIARRVDGIVLAPLDSSALVAPVETALSVNIPVVIVDSGLKSDRYSSYIATDNYHGGELGAEHLAKIINGIGKIILVRYQVGSASTEEREAGFMNTMTNKYPGIKILSQNQYAGPTRDSAYKAAQDLLNRYGKDVNGIFAPCEPVTIGVMLALRDMGKAGGIVKLVGFDAGTQSVDGLSKGDVQGLVVQNPMKMGYLGVKAIVDVAQKKKVVKKVDTGVHVITKENMDQLENRELLHPPLDQYLK